MIYKTIIILFFTISLYAKDTKFQKYYTQSLDGNITATFKVGLAYYKGDGVKRDLNKAYYYFDVARSYGDIKATFNIGLLYFNKKFKKYDPKKGFKILKKLAQNNHPKAQYYVGYSLLRGIGTTSNNKEALEWFEYSYFKNNYIESSCMIALMYANGFGRFQNLGRANKMAQIGAKKHLPICLKTIKEFKLYKYKEDKGFRFGYYR